MTLQDCCQDAFVVKIPIRSSSHDRRNPHSTAGARVTRNPQSSNEFICTRSVAYQPEAQTPVPSQEPHYFDYATLQQIHDLEPSLYFGSPEFVEPRPRHSPPPSASGSYATTDAPWAHRNPENERAAQSLDSQGSSTFARNTHVLRPGVETARTIRDDISPTNAETIIGEEIAGGSEPLRLRGGAGEPDNESNESISSRADEDDIASTVASEKKTTGLGETVGSRKFGQSWADMVDEDEEEFLKLAAARPVAETNVAQPNPTNWQDEVKVGNTLPLSERWTERHGKDRYLPTRSNNSKRPKDEEGGSKDYSTTAKEPRSKHKSGDSKDLSWRQSSDWRSFSPNANLKEHLRRAPPRYIEAPPDLRASSSTVTWKSIKAEKATPAPVVKNREAGSQSYRKVAGSESSPVKSALTRPSYAIAAATALAPPVGNSPSSLQRVTVPPTSTRALESVLPASSKSGDNTMAKSYSQALVDSPVSALQSSVAGEVEHHSRKESQISARERSQDQVQTPRALAPSPLVVVENPPITWAERLRRTLPQVPPGKGPEPSKRPKRPELPSAWKDPSPGTTDTTSGDVVSTNDMSAMQGQSRNLDGILSEESTSSLKAGQDVGSVEATFGQGSQLLSRSVAVSEKFAEEQTDNVKGGAAEDKEGRKTKAESSQAVDEASKECGSKKDNETSTSNQFTDHSMEGQQSPSAPKPPSIEIRSASSRRPTQTYASVVRGATLLPPSSPKPLEDSANPKSSQNSSISSSNEGYLTAPQTPQKPVETKKSRQAEEAAQAVSKLEAGRLSKTAQAVSMVESEAGIERGASTSLEANSEDTIRGHVQDEASEGLSDTGNATQDVTMKTAPPIDMKDAQEASSPDPQIAPVEALKKLEDSEAGNSQGGESKAEKAVGHLDDRLVKSQAQEDFLSSSPKSRAKSLELKEEEAAQPRAKLPWAEEHEVAHPPPSNVPRPAATTNPALSENTTRARPSVTLGPPLIHHPLYFQPHSLPAFYGPHNYQPRPRNFTYPYSANTFAPGNIDLQPVYIPASIMGPAAGTRQTTGIDAMYPLPGVQYPVFVPYQAIPGMMNHPQAAVLYPHPTMFPAHSEYGVLPRHRPSTRQQRNPQPGSAAQYTQGMMPTSAPRNASHVQQRSAVEALTKAVYTPSVQPSSSGIPASDRTREARSSFTDRPQHQSYSSNSENPALDQTRDARDSSFNRPQSQPHYHQYIRQNPQPTAHTSQPRFPASPPPQPIPSPLSRQPAVLESVRTIRPCGNFVIEYATELLNRQCPSCDP